MATYSEAGPYYNAMDPAAGAGNANWYWRSGYMGAPTSPQTPAQLQQITGLAASGIQQVEVGVLRPELWEAVPREHFAEIKRLGKLTIRDFEKEGKPSPFSIHAPILEPTGFQENRFSEDFWKEQQAWMQDVVEKAAIVGTSTPIAIHASHFPSQFWRYAPEEAKVRLGQFEKAYQALASQDKAIADEYRKQHQFAESRWRAGEVLDTMQAVDPVSGQVIPLQAEERVYPWGKKLMDPIERLDERNNTYWQEEMQKRILEYRRAAMEAAARAKEARTDVEKANWGAMEKRYEEDARSAALTIFDHVARADKAFVESSNVKPILGQIAKIEDREKRADAVADFLLAAGRTREIPESPKIFHPVEDFAREKASTAFANMALHGYEAATDPKRFGLVDQTGKPLFTPMRGDQAPVVAIENVYPYAMAGRGDTMRELVKDTREKLIARLEKEKKMSHSEAKKLAEKLVGTTWDVAHINLLRRFGFDEKKLLQEVENIRKDVKHVHISDNFGFTDAHLAPGAGNVNIKDQMKVLDKEGKLAKMRSIVEAGNWVQHFRTSPWPQTLQYFNSPVYAWQQAPQWGGPAGEMAMNTYFMGTSGYGGGYGTILPEVHFSEYGSGFSQLPSALGAPIRKPAERSAFAGAPVS